MPIIRVISAYENEVVEVRWTCRGGSVYIQRFTIPPKDVRNAREVGMIDKPYAYHKPSADGMAKINKLREHFSEGERLMKEICPESRQRSVAITNNEQTAMWAIKSVVFNDPDSEVTVD